MFDPPPRGIKPFQFPTMAAMKLFVPKSSPLGAGLAFVADALKVAVSVVDTSANLVPQVGAACRCVGLQRRRSPAPNPPQAPVCAIVSHGVFPWHWGCLLCSVCLSRGAVTALYVKRVSDVRHCTLLSLSLSLSILAVCNSAVFVCLTRVTGVPLPHCTVWRRVCCTDGTRRRRAVVFHSFCHPQGVCVCV